MIGSLKEKFSTKDVSEAMCSYSKFFFGFVAGVAIAFIVSFFTLITLVKNGSSLSGKQMADDGSKGVVPAAAPQEQQVSPEQIAGNIGLDKKAFSSCFEAKKFADKINQQVKDATDIGVNGTPFSVLVYGKQRIPVSGALPEASIQAMIDALLSGKDVPGVSAEDKKAGTSMKLVPVSASDWVRGDKNAKITIVEYSDLECPFCQRFHVTLQSILEKNKGKVNWVYRHFPLVSIHQFAEPLAQGAECAGDLGGNEVFWKYLDENFKG